MSKNIVVFTGSPRTGGNTDILAGAFIDGALSAGNRVTCFPVGRMDIGGCLDCKYCFSHGGECMRTDDMQKIYPALRQADILVLATPIYFYGISAQTMLAVDRMFAGCRNPFPISGIVFLAVFGDSDEAAAEPAVAHFRAISHYMDWKNIGTVIQGGVHGSGEIRGMASLAAAGKLGHSIR